MRLASLVTALLASASAHSSSAPLPSSYAPPTPLPPPACTQDDFMSIGSCIASEMKDISLNECAADEALATCINTAQCAVCEELTVVIGLEASQLNHELEALGCAARVCQTPSETVDEDDFDENEAAKGLCGLEDYDKVVACIDSFTLGAEAEGDNFCLAESYIIACIDDYPCDVCDSDLIPPEFADDTKKVLEEKGCTARLCATDIDQGGSLAPVTPDTPSASDAATPSQTPSPGDGGSSPSHGVAVTLGLLIGLGLITAIACLSTTRTRRMEPHRMLPTDEHGLEMEIHDTSANAITAGREKGEFV